MRNIKQLEMRKIKQLRRPIVGGRLSARATE
jgi:hypothetical protein